MEKNNRKRIIQKRTRFKNKKIRKNKKKNHIRYLFKIFIIILLYVNLIYFVNKSNQVYFACFIGKAKLENKYIRELVEHYLSIGFEKFYFGDDDILESEKLYYVLKDYVNKGIVNIDDVSSKNWSQEYYYQYAFEKAKSKCKWFAFYDLDEYLEFADKDMTIKSYLSLDVFNKCDVVKIHWVMYYDNDLVNYDNRTLKERFPIPNHNSDDRLFHKSLVRSKDYNGTIWAKELGPHQPNESLVNMCDAVGNLDNKKHGTLGYPNYKHCHINHYRTKTAEEYGYKILKGLHRGEKYNINEMIKNFFKYNKVTEEKVAILEKVLNTTFPDYHKNSKII